MGFALNLLLDTHALIWWMLDDPQLSRKAHEAISNEENVAFVSAVSAFEISTKFKIGKLPEAEYLVPNFESVIRQGGFEPLSVRPSDGVRAGALTLHHKDPFDRILIAQALGGDLTFVSNEKLFDDYGVKRLW
jgi:PIN domain nuclease of toxin-antitoxin system